MSQFWKIWVQRHILILSVWRHFTRFIQPTSSAAGQYEKIQQNSFTYYIFEKKKFSFSLLTTEYHDRDLALTLAWVWKHSVKTAVMFTCFNPRLSIALRSASNQPPGPAWSLDSEWKCFTSVSTRQDTVANIITSCIKSDTFIRGAGGLL